MKDTEAVVEPPPRLDLGTLGILFFCYLTMAIGNVMDYSLAENANYIPPEIHSTSDQWADLVGGLSLYIRAIVCLLVTGELIDNLHSIRLLTCMLVIAGICTLLFTVGASFSAFLALRIAYSLPVTAFYTIGLKFTFTRIHPHFHLIASAVLLFGTCSSDALAVILERSFTTNWKGSFYVDAVLMFGLAAVCVIVPDKSGGQPDADQARPWSVMLAEMLHTYRVFLRMLRSAPALVAWVAWLGVIGGAYATTTLTQLWLVQDLGFPASDIATAMIPLRFMMVRAQLLTHAGRPHAVAPPAQAAPHALAARLAHMWMSACTHAHAKVGLPNAFRGWTALEIHLEMATSPRVMPHTVAMQACHQPIHHRGSHRPSEGGHVRPLHSGGSCGDRVAVAGHRCRRHQRAGHRSVRAHTATCPRPRDDCQCDQRHAQHHDDAPPAADGAP